MKAPSFTKFNRLRHYLSDSYLVNYFCFCYLRNEVVIIKKLYNITNQIANIAVLYSKLLSVENTFRPKAASFSHVFCKGGSLVASNERRFL